MKCLILISLLLSSLPLLADVCNYNYKKDTAQLTWTAFKTPKKIGVKAGFKKIEIKTQEAKDIHSVISSASFSVDIASLDSGNPERDAKIKKHFFKTDSSTVGITGKVLSLKDGVAQVEFTINKKTKTVPMNVLVANDEATITGKIDVLDFALNESLSAINEACKVLHEGKTWSDVELSIKAPFINSCKK